MKFMVTRTSGRYCDHDIDTNKGNPCEEAILEDAELILKDGTQSHIKVWTIELSNLDELLNFQCNYGDIIILDSPVYGIEKHIEIYDMTRE